MKGLECLREYKAEWDPDARTFRKTPAHNWASHGADGWRGLSLSWREPMKVDEPGEIRGATEMTMEEAWRLGQIKQPANARI
jgi:hypothetical protein